MTWWAWLLVAVATALGVLLVYDLSQRKHALLRNFPLVGHLRYLLEAIGPELRQYIVVDNDDREALQPRPAAVDLHRRRRGSTPTSGSGPTTTSRSRELPDHQAVAFPLLGPHPGEPGYDAALHVPAAKVFGGPRGPGRRCGPPSLVNVSSMSYGALGSAAIESLNRGGALSGPARAAGRAGSRPYHQHGGDLVWQIGTGYFGCRDGAGRFDLERFRSSGRRPP